MPASNSRGDEETAEFIAFEEFRNGWRSGRFHIIVNPELARRFVAQWIHATPLSIAIIGCGIASALGGYVMAGAVLVALGVFFRRAVRWQAAKLLLEITSRQASAYYAATANGVMEIRRN